MTANHAATTPDGTPDYLQGSFRQVLGFKLHVIDKGHGAPVLLLHGFPNSATLYKHQIPFLLDQGFRVIVPDLLGSGRSELVQETEPYTLDNQVAQLKDILDQLGVDKAAVVGHDWGAALAWHFAALAPERTSQLVAMSVGHPAQYFATGEQQQLSWYMLIFLNKGAAEEVLMDGSVFAKCIPASQAPHMATDELKQLFVDLARPGAATAGLNWYRANINPKNYVAGYITQTPPVSADTMMVWFPGDEYVCSEAQAKGSKDFCKGGFRYERVECDSHFGTWFAPDEVNRVLGDFLRKA